MLGWGAFVPGRPPTLAVSPVGEGEGRRGEEKRKGETKGWDGKREVSGVETRVGANAGTALHCL